jgi:hypothetical protein
MSCIGENEVSRDSDGGYHDLFQGPISVFAGKN